MTVQEFIWRAGGEPKEHELVGAEGMCPLCGAKVTSGVQVKKIIGSSFTNFDDMGTGAFFCEPCANILKGPFSRQLRVSAFYATETGIHYFKFDDLAKMLFMKHEIPFVLCHTSSWKKHNAFRATLNNNDSEFRVRWEDRFVDIERESAKSLFKAMLELYYGGFTKDEIAFNLFPQHRCAKFGIERFFELYEIIEPFFGTNLIEFLREALPSKRREAYLKAMKAKQPTGGKKNATEPGRKSSQVGLFSLEEH